MTVPGCLVAPALGFRDHSLLAAIQAAGLTANLKLCVDAGDQNSYASGQKWLDRSGGGYDFFLGADGSAAADDPVLTGSPGTPLAYWATDGVTHHRYDTTNETWMEALHKDNAAFTVFCVYRHAGAGSQATVFGTCASAGTNTGVTLEVNTGRQINFNVSNAGSVVLNKDSGGGDVNSNAINMIALSINEATGAGGGFTWANGDIINGPWDSTYTSPAAGNATYTMELGAGGNASNVSGGSVRFYCTAIWSAALTEANLDALRLLLLPRFFG